MANVQVFDFLVKILSEGGFCAMCWACKISKSGVQRCTTWQLRQKKLQHIESPKLL